MTEEREKLKPCPFCGELPLLYTGRFLTIYCASDACLGVSVEDHKAEAIAAWNRRTPVPSDATLDMERRAFSEGFDAGWAADHNNADDAWNARAAMLPSSPVPERE